MLRIYIVEENIACVRLFKARNGAQQRGFAGARRAEQGQQLSAFDLQRHIPQDGKCAELLFEIFRH